MTKEQGQILERVETVFVPLLKDVFSDHLSSVMLYGSSVKGRFADGVSDVNVLILVDHDDPDAVMSLGKKAARFMTKNRISPLIMTVDDFTNSGDVFPMEYLDIKHSRKVISGRDVTLELEIAKANLRHQVEEQLRGSINSLRKALLYGRGKPAAAKRLLKEWFGAQNALFRGLLRLKGEESVPVEPEELAGKLASVFNVPANVLVDIIRFRNGEKLDPIATVKGLLSLLTALAESVDRMEA